MLRAIYEGFEKSKVFARSTAAQPLAGRRTRNRLAARALAEPVVRHDERFWIRYDRACFPDRAGLRGWPSILHEPVHRSLPARLNCSAPLGQSEFPPLAALRVQLSTVLDLDR